MTFTTDVVIGLEVHVELKTQSKLFCACARLGDESPNSRACPVCLGHPGSKPVVNKKAIEYAIRLGLALKCDIAKQVIFSRKSYFYPDMSKNYQITQYEEPIGRRGELKLSTGSIVNLTRIHLEEDPASLVHSGSVSFIDYNRSGNPLIEIVTAPDLDSPEKARDFLKRLVTLLEYLEIFDTKGCILKADANISIKESGYSRVEIKNVTGFREIERALFYEVERQKKDWQNHKRIAKETRGWDAQKGLTYSMRSKESEEDYGYIIDTDLVPINLPQHMIKGIKDTLPELADEKVERFATKGISLENAKVISQDKEMAQFLDKVIQLGADPDTASKWVRRELARVLNSNKTKLKDAKLSPKHIADLVQLVHKGTITDRIGQRIIEKLAESCFDVAEYVKKEGLATVADTGELEKHCKDAIKENPIAVESFKKGEEKSFNFLVGKVMQKTKGKADPTRINEMLKGLLK